MRKSKFRVAGATQDATSADRCDLTQDPSIYVYIYIYNTKHHEFIDFCPIKDAKFQASHVCAETFGNLMFTLTHHKDFKNKIT